MEKINQFLVYINKTEDRNYLYAHSSTISSRLCIVNVSDENFREITISHHKNIDILYDHILAYTFARYYFYAITINVYRLCEYQQ